MGIGSKGYRIKILLLELSSSLPPSPTNNSPQLIRSPFTPILITTKLASSIPRPEFLDPYLDHLTPYISPCLSSLDDFLTSLQLSISPSTPPKPLPDILPHILVSLGVVLTLAVFMRRFFSRSQGSTKDSYAADDAILHIAGDLNPNPNRPEDYVTVKYGQQEFMLKYPVNAVTGGAVTVGHVRSESSKITSIEPNHISLTCAGKNLKGDSVTLKSLGISHASRILLMSTPSPVSDPASDSAIKPKKKKKKGGKKVAAASVTPEPEVKKVLTAMEKIDVVWDGIGVTLMPLIDEFMTNAPVDSVKRADAHRRLSETMMGELLKLDSVESGDPEVRAKRKEVVKDIQKVLDELDRVLKEETQVDFDLD